MMTDTQRLVFLLYVKLNPTYRRTYMSGYMPWSKIPLIKTWRSIFGDGLKESKEAVEQLEAERYFNREESYLFLTTKSEDFIDRMHSIEEIQIELVKFILLSPGQEQYDEFTDLLSGLQSKLES